MAAHGTIRRGWWTGAPRLRLMASVMALAAAIGAVAPGQALAVDPEDAVGGTGSKWFSGSLLQQSGNNCSIIGGSYSETMVSAIAGYGGAPGGQMVKVGDRYYASVLISIPGNPCGPGSAFVGTDLVLPRGTSVDPTAPIRCFGWPRSATAFGEITGGNWSFTFPNGNTSSGPYCPAQVGASLTGTSGAVGVGYRPLASGTLYQLFVPIKSTLSLQGAAASPADEIRWVLSSSGTYDNLGTTSVWANVLPAGSPTGPFIYFARAPATGFWNASAPLTPSDLRNRVELFVNLYTGGFAGTLCYEVRRVSDNSLRATCTIDPGYNQNVPAGLALAQLQPGAPLVTGPNGGYAPFAFDPPSLADPIGEWDRDMKIIWSFSYNDGTPKTAKGEGIFHTLAGPDTDGDGVPDVSDTCSTVKGTLPNGCQPAVQADPDGDGVFGAADKCPTENGGGTADGCPVTKLLPPPPTPSKDSDGDGILDADDACPTVAAKTANGCPVVALTASLGTIRGNRLKRSALAKGVALAITCRMDAKAVATLSVKSAVAKKLKITVRKKQKTVTIGTASGTCRAAKAGRLTLKLARTLAAKVRRPRTAVAATLTIVFTRAGSRPVTITRALKLT